MHVHAPLQMSSDDLYDRTCQDFICAGPAKAEAGERPAEAAAFHGPSPHTPGTQSGALINMLTASRQIICHMCTSALPDVKLLAAESNISSGSFIDPCPKNIMARAPLLPSDKLPSSAFPFEEVAHHKHCAHAECAAARRERLPGSCAGSVPAAAIAWPHAAATAPAAEAACPAPCACSGCCPAGSITSAHPTPLAAHQHPPPGANPLLSLPSPLRRREALHGS